MVYTVAVSERADRDRELHDRWKAGDSKARDALILSLGWIARKIASRYRGMADPDDLASEAQVGICQAVNVWRGAGTISGFAYKCARDRALDYVRATRPAVARTMSIHGVSSTETISEWRASGYQEEAAVLLEIRNLAERILPPAELDVVLMRAADMSGPRIAAQVGCSKVTICRLERSAMTRLSEAVRDDDQPV